MRVAVIGAGIVGVTTAHALAVDGHEVSVFERGASVAAQASFANAGVNAPGAVAAWGAPGRPSTLMQQLFGRQATVRLTGPQGARLAWAWRTWRAASAAGNEAQCCALHSLALSSDEQLQTLRQQLGLDYERSLGHLHLLRSPRELAAARPSLDRLEQLGIAHQVLSPAQCLRAEPGLNPEAALHAGILLGQGEVGNCRQFALLLRQDAARLGVRFRFHTTVQAIEPGAQLRHAYTPPEEGQLASAREAADSADGPSTQPMPSEAVLERFDAVVICAAADSLPLLRPLGLKLPLVPLHGYSITAPLRQLEAHPDFGPRAAVVDERTQVTISRIGQRVRVSGGAELGSAAGAVNPRIIEALHQVLHDWFPGATQGGAIQRWRGARPMLPDGAPVLGASGAPGVWLNLGHGDHGWALACGSARWLADEIGGRSPGLDASSLGVSRLR